MEFNILSEITHIEIIAKGRAIKEINRLNKYFGKGKWRKLKGTAKIIIAGKVYNAEIHWYEAHGIGKKEFKIKNIIT